MGGGGGHNTLTAGQMKGRSLCYYLSKWGEPVTQALCMGSYTQRQGNSKLEL